MKMLKELIRRLKIWRYESELKRRYPDPLIVCRDAKNCAHVDGYVCNPLECEQCEEPDGLYSTANNRISELKEGGE